jgi:hypothetical protein
MPADYNHFLSQVKRWRRFAEFGLFLKPFSENAGRKKVKFLTN